LITHLETLSCICCGAALPNIMAGRGIQPMGGVAFLSHGHFGSSVFDPMDGSIIQIVLCDPCLSEKGWHPADLPRKRSEAPGPEGEEEITTEMLDPLLGRVSGQRTEEKQESSS